MKKRLSVALRIAFVTPVTAMPRDVARADVTFPTAIALTVT